MFINLTPHVVNIYDGETLIVTLPPSGTVARVSTDAIRVDTVEGVPIYVNRYGPIVDLPEPAEGAFTLYVVSAFVRSTTSRRDVASPGELKRNDAGQPVGCVGLVVNP